MREDAYEVVLLIPSDLRCGFEGRSDAVAAVVVGQVDRVLHLGLDACHAGFRGRQ